MNRSMKFAFGVHLINACWFIAFGVIYLIRPDFMPYHAVAVASDWAAVDRAYQILILALMRVTGGAWLGVGVAIIILLFIPFRQGQHWARWAIPAIAIIVSASATYATLLVRFNTPGEPPWLLAITGVVLSLAGWMASSSSQPKRRKLRGW